MSGDYADNTSASDYNNSYNMANTSNVVTTGIWSYQ